MSKVAFTQIAVVPECEEMRVGLVALDQQGRAWGCWHTAGRTWSAWTIIPPPDEPEAAHIEPPLTEYP